MWSTAHGHEAALAMPYGTVMPCLRIIIERVLFVMRAPYLWLRHVELACPYLSVQY